MSRLEAIDTALMVIGILACILLGIGALNEMQAGSAPTACGPVTTIGKGDRLG